ncbi:MAG: PQ-loop repeat-containing protein [Cytophagaceae bacterium]|nr:MAG: PQ-loop repeat-containing protein [Cytophagaceae bacterium]
MSLLQFATLPLSIISKAPQIISNHQNQSTGNLSAFAVFNALLGCIARLFTTSQEVKDPLIFWGFAAAGLLNAVLAAQMLMYWKNNDAPAKYKRRATEEGLYSPARLETEPSTAKKSVGRKLD